MFCIVPMMSGYVSSGYSSFTSNNPLYSFTIADNSSLYEQLALDNPSLPLATMLYRIQSNNAILAIAPNTYSSSLYSEVQALRQYFVEQSAMAGFNASSTIELYQDQSSLDNYMTSKT